MSTIEIIKGNERLCKFGVEKIPNRKNKALVKYRGAMVEVLAYFRSDDDAEEFQKIIDLISKLGGDDECD